MGNGNSLKGSGMGKMMFSKRIGLKGEQIRKSECRKEAFVAVLGK